MTELGKEVLYGKRTIQLAVISREDFSVKARRQRQKENAAKVIDEAGKSEDMELFNKLKEVRKRIADEHHWPAYVVLSDKSLHHLAIEMPTTLVAFGNTFGIGEHKRDSFGAEFIDVIKEYAPTKEVLPFDEVATIAPVTEKSLSYMERQKQLHAKAYAPWTDEDDNWLKQLVKDGHPIKDIASFMERNNGAIKSRMKKLGIEL